MGEAHIPADAAADRQRLRDLINGYRLTQSIYVVATLGIPDLIGERACDTSELATATGSNADALHRVLRALAAARLLHEDPEGKFRLTELGMGLRSDVADSLTKRLGEVRRATSNVGCLEPTAPHRTDRRERLSPSARTKHLAISGSQQ